MNQEIKFKQAKKDSKLIYDVGMHKGEDTDYYLKKGFKVIAFEADPELIAQCKKRFEKEIEDGQLIIIEGAIIEHLNDKTKSGTVKFFKNNDVSVWGTVVNTWANRNELFGTSNKIIEVSVVDFSNCLIQYGIPHYLKIDIEGMDTECLRTMINFEQKPDYISIESEKLSFKKLKEEFNLFKKLGYSKFLAINQATIPCQKEPEISKEGRYLDYKFHEGSSGLFGSDLQYEWKKEKQILKKYKWIFIGYKLFGDNGKLGNFYLVKLFLRLLNKFMREPIPGWYDTHAKHLSDLKSN